MPNVPTQGILNPIEPSPDWLLELINSQLTVPTLQTVTNVLTSPVTLPAATGSQTFLGVKNSSGGTLTITPAGSDTIDGVSGSQTTFGSTVMRANTAVLLYDSAAGQWLIIAIYSA